MRISPAKRAAAALSAMVLVGLLSACGGDDGDSAGSSSEPLEVWSRSSPDPAKTYQEIMAAFTKKTGIKVDYKGVIELDTQLQARASSKDLPDVWINDAYLLGSYQSHGYVTKVEKGDIAGGDQIPDETWAQNQAVDGQIYGVPFSRQTFGTLVRSDWRKKLGLPQPKTWDELAALANAFATKDPDGNGKADTYGMVVPGSSKKGYIGWWASSYIWQAGGGIVEKSGEAKYKSVINSPQTKTALEWIRKQFCTPGNVVPGSLNLTTSETPFFGEGTAGIYLTGPYTLSGYDKNLGKDKYEVVPMPKGPVGTTTLADGETIYFGAGSKKTDQQKALAEFLISPEAQKIGMAASGATQPVVRLPVNKTLDAGAVRNDPRWKLFQDEYNANSKSFVWAIDFQPIRQALGEGINKMMSSCTSDLDAGLKTLDEAITAELKSQDLAE
ncbi:sugar ABC transporter substrate-binding protein [Kribbella sp. NBC_01245]|uniref:ABC transporter substrate-binding protein n=1 Tax=Kribbella sp. NBC_01245 TaxID=2903578 RepID=UPI002E2D6C0C|nr:sugar ABC transporter substrate-binding protein [Kribbella sp. NBC_01245]